MTNRRSFSTLLIVVLLSGQISTSCATPNINREDTPTNSDLSTLPDEEIKAQEEVISAPVENLPPEDIVFLSADGIQLEGRIYPARIDNSPLIILMHWAPGDQDDWKAIAAWLQNPGTAQMGLVEEGLKPWLDSSWFPKMLPDASFNVFTFTFRNCEGGCSSFERSKWYEDVKGAVDFAVNFDGIDPTKIIMIGASIGSDGAVDGCAYLNQRNPGACLGAFSMSPGNYLTIDFAEKVQELGETPVWCLYAEQDSESAKICGNIESENYSSFSFPATMTFSNGHGMNLIEENYSPNPLELMVEFLAEKY